ncbi:18859_t:CDS:1 [Funneliformis geosporum]|uniref:2683_t:CDS:1 n=1 Tax=Funneliformis geosporum TaxID=1117311 RepID=A0A9W4SBL6_9GLOM|nr:2683_t:CDS:1 [Funneliformis geosporum]CAI2171599.1 18859_t:CDS:1 [Funneliformis geosporum]
MTETNILYDFAVFTLNHSQNPLFLLADAVTISEKDEGSIYSTSDEDDSTLSSPTSSEFSYPEISLHYAEIPFKGSGRDEPVPKIYDQRNRNNTEFKDPSLNNIKNIKSRNFSNYFIKDLRNCSNLNVKDSQHVPNHAIGSNFKIPKNRKTISKMKMLPVDDSNDSSNKTDELKPRPRRKKVEPLNQPYVTRSKRISKPTSGLSGGRWGGI